MNTIDAILSRRSIRHFRPDRIPDEHLQLILEAARSAPSAGNEQPWLFLVVRRKANLRRLRKKLERWVGKRIHESRAADEEKKERNKFSLLQLERIFTASVFVFIFVDTRRYPDLAGIQGALAAENLMLAARSLGYGTSFQTTFFPHEIISRHFHAPDSHHLVCTIPIGYPLECPPRPPQKSIEEIVQYETIRRENEHK